jgi:hypothetical protein
LRRRKAAAPLSSRGRTWPLDRSAGKGVLAARGRDEPRRDAPRRGLAASGRADDADDLAAPDLERELPQYQMVAEGEIDVAKFDQRRCVADHEARSAPFG